MNCAIYKGHKKADTYLYVARKDDFVCVPEALLSMLGRLELVMELELGPERCLVMADVKQVRESLGQQGYYLQMPPRSGGESPLEQHLKKEGFYMQVPKK